MKRAARLYERVEKMLLPTGSRACPKSKDEVRQRKFRAIVGLVAIALMATACAPLPPRAPSPRHHQTEPMHKRG